MNDKYILAPGCNGAELIRTCAKMGINTFGWRVVNATELAQDALIISGVLVGKRIISNKEETSIIYSLIKEIPYFKSVSYQDAENAAKVLENIRSLALNDEDEELSSTLIKGEFQEKNNALLELYHNYISMLDSKELIDRIGLIRKAIHEAKNFNKEIILLEEYPVSALENEFVKRISTNVKNTNLSELLDLENEEEPKIELTRCYGESNEVEHVIWDILKNNIPLDKCTIAVTNVRTYSQLFLNMSVLRDLDISFGCGVNITNSNPAKLLKAYLKWDTDGYHGAEALSELMFGDFFNREEINVAIKSAGSDLQTVVEVAGRIRLCRDKKENDVKISNFYDFLESNYDFYGKEKYEKAINVIKDSIAKEFELEPELFIAKYSKIRKDRMGRIDRSAINVIREGLSTYFAYSNNSDLEEISNSLLSKTVCSENSKGGSLYVTNLVGALASMRENLYIVGLSSDYFPGTPIENNLALDSDYKLFNIDESYSSKESILKKIETYENLTTLANKLGTKIKHSYSSYDLAGLKEKNISSVVDCKETGNVGFFDTELSNDREIGKAYIEGKNIGFNSPSKEEIKVLCNLERRFSPSDIDTYITCPRKFLYSRVLGLQDKQEEKPFEQISAAELGTLVHSMMQAKAKYDIKDIDTFMDKGDSLIKAFFKGKVPIISDTSKSEAVIKEILKNAFEQDPNYEVVYAEKKIESEYVCESDGEHILVGGIVDRLEKTNSGEYIVVDYKTGKATKHDGTDVKKCMQVLLYAHIINEEDHIDISKCEYRYPSIKQIVKVQNDSTMQDALDNLLYNFKEDVKNANYQCVPTPFGEEPCKYCSFRDFCKGEKK